MRLRLAALLVLGATAAGGAQEIVSAYTDLAIDEHCSVFAGADDGDWARMVCSGYRGYPVVIHYSDLRESIFYGFPPDGEPGPAWESFGSFNAAGPKVEWRIEKDGDRETPFATIHRWFATGPDDERIEVLVVEKVGQVDEREGCAVGYVAATGNADANDKARRIADAQARDFACGDQPVIDAGSVPVPDFVRWEN